MQIPAVDLPDLDRLALLVVDVQRGFDDTGYWGPRNNPQCEDNIAADRAHFDGASIGCSGERGQIYAQLGLDSRATRIPRVIRIAPVTRSIQARNRSMTGRSPVTRKVKDTYQVSAIPTRIALIASSCAVVETFGCKNCGMMLR